MRGAFWARRQRRAWAFSYFLRVVYSAVGIGRGRSGSDFPLLILAPFSFILLLELLCC
ncbi:hypothetical protein BC834DRAFT_917580 [Gloeopeniophorella convolvens]|nr:hypothetical protein BC834DRAFT_917580 [Gloeopeniophorella convolvens]